MSESEVVLACRQETVRKMAVMELYAEGRMIELKAKNSQNWHAISDPVWDWHSFDYRVA